MNPDPGHEDLVDVLATDHRDLLDLLDRAAATEPARWDTDLAERATDAVRRHCAVEEAHLHPVLRRCLEDGERHVQQDVEEHEQLERLVDELASTGPGSPAARDVLRALAGATRRHVEGIEGARLPVLRAQLTVTELHELARAARTGLVGVREAGPPSREPVVG